jgi:N-acetylglucosaminyldiphosphoundecaprenol N-acetyl-beta-D-mannosaminyltransferase
VKPHESVVTVLGVTVNAIRSRELLNKLEECILERRGGVFAYANVHAINLAQKYGWFREFLNNATVLYTDGEGVRLGARLLGYHIPERIALTTWVWELMKFCERKRFRVFLLGSKEEVVKKAAGKAVEREPGLQIVGVHHGFFEKKGLSSDGVIAEINVARPDVLLVGFGMPLQEEWLQENMRKISVGVIFTAGSCFEYMAGVRSICPAWLSRAGFEWLYRLLQEPRRLFARYVIGNPLFVLRVLRQRLSMKSPRETS